MNIPREGGFQIPRAKLPIQGGKRHPENNRQTPRKKAEGKKKKLTKKKKKREEKEARGLKGLPGAKKLLEKG